MIKAIIISFLISFSVFSLGISQEMAREKRFTFVFKPVYQYDFTQENSRFGTEIGMWYHTYDMIYLSDSMLRMSKFFGQVSIICKQQ